MEKAPLTSTRVPQAPMPPVPRDAATEAALPHDDVADVPLEMATGNKKKKKKGKRADSDASLAVKAEFCAVLLCLNEIRHSLVGWRVHVRYEIR